MVQRLVYESLRAGGDPTVTAANAIREALVELEERRPNLDKVRELLIRARSDCENLKLVVPNEMPVFAQGKLGELRCGNCGSENLREIKKEPVYSGGLGDSPEFPAPVRHHVGDDYVLACEDCGATNIHVDQWMYID